MVSGLAVSFLLWLLYVHHASADFAGRWMFLPALNALLNGLCAIALCAGLYFIKNRDREAHRTSMLLASLSLPPFSSVTSSTMRCTATRCFPATVRCVCCIFPF